MGMDILLSDTQTHTTEEYACKEKPTSDCRVFAHPKAIAKTLKIAFLS